MCTTSGNIHLLTPSLCTPNCQLLPSTTVDQTHHPARDAFLPSSMRLPTRKESGKYYTERTSHAACRLQARLDAILTHWLGSIHVHMLLGLHQSSHLHAKAANTPGTAWQPAERTTGPDQTDTHSITLRPPLNQYCSPAEQPITLTGVAGQGPGSTHAAARILHPKHTCTPVNHSHTCTSDNASRCTALLLLHSELNQLLSCVANLLQVGYASKLDHGWGPTHGHNGIWARRQQVLPHHVFVDEATAVLPVLRGPTAQHGTGHTEHSLVKMVMGTACRHLHYTAESRSHWGSRVCVQQPLSSCQGQTELTTAAHIYVFQEGKHSGQAQRGSGCVEVTGPEPLPMTVGSGTFDTTLPTAAACIKSDRSAQVPLTCRVCSAA
jgi:hypothetical protein